MGGAEAEGVLAAGKDIASPGVKDHVCICCGILSHARDNLCFQIVIAMLLFLCAGKPR